ncbi:unnamed protein product [Closterium sp. NIES-64]|nr:unnamed protein product [Closterium sp. NIES-64]
MRFRSASLIAAPSWVAIHGQKQQQGLPQEHEQHISLQQQQQQQQQQEQEGQQDDFSPTESSSAGADGDGNGDDAVGEGEGAQDNTEKSRRFGPRESAKKTDRSGGETAGEEGEEVEEKKGGRESVEGEEGEEGVESQAEGKLREAEAMLEGVGRERERREEEHLDEIMKRLNGGEEDEGTGGGGGKKKKRKKGAEEEEEEEEVVVSGKKRGEGGSKKRQEVEEEESGEGEGKEEEIIDALLKGIGGGDEVEEKEKGRDVGKGGKRSEVGEEEARGGAGNGSSTGSGNGSSSGGSGGSSLGTGNGGEDDSAREIHEGDGTVIKAAETEKGHGEGEQEEKREGIGGVAASSEIGESFGSTHGSSKKDGVEEGSAFKVASGDGDREGGAGGASSEPASGELSGASSVDVQGEPTAEVGGSNDHADREKEGEGAGTLGDGKSGAEGKGDKENGADEEKQGADSSNDGEEQGEGSEGSERSSAGKGNSGDSVEADATSTPAVSAAGHAPASLPSPATAAAPSAASEQGGVAGGSDGPEEGSQQQGQEQEAGQQGENQDVEQQRGTGGDVSIPGTAEESALNDTAAAATATAQGSHPSVEPEESNMLGGASEDGAAASAGASATDPASNSSSGLSGVSSDGGGSETVPPDSSASQGSAKKGLFSWLGAFVAMIRRNARLRREYLYRKNLEGKERVQYEKKLKIRQALQEGRPVPTELRNEALALRDEIDLEDDYTAEPRSHVDDEYARAGEEDPRVLLTTSRDPSSRLTQFVKELKIVFPNAQRINRGGQVINEIVASARSSAFTDIIVVHEHRGQPDGLVVCHLPYGPTAYFGLLNVVTRHDIQDRAAIGTMSEAYPHLILDNFSTKLGQRTSNILKYLFPVPKPDSKRVITFANQSDYISFRHHVYEKPQGPKSLQLKEVGPRFELRLFSASPLPHARASSRRIRRGVISAVAAGVAGAAGSNKTRLARATELAQWLASAGFPAQPVAPADAGAAGIGLSAKEPIKKGQVALRVPENFVVTSVDVAEHPVVAKAAEGRGDLVGLTLWLMWERSQGDASLWAPYIRTFPEATSSPLLWPADDRQRLLAGTTIADEIDGRVAEMEAVYSVLKATHFDADPSTFPTSPTSAPFSSESFKNAFAVVLSRAVYLPSVDLFALIPLADLVNHSPAPSNPAIPPPSSFDFDPASQCVVLRSNIDLSSGDPLLASYGADRTPADLLLTYGFVPRSSPSDFILLPVSLVPGDPLLEFKRQILNDQGLSVSEMFPLFTDRFPRQLIAFMRLARLQDAAQLAGISFERDVMLSEANEYEALQILLRDCNDRIAEFPQTLEDDLRLLNLGSAVSAGAASAAAAAAANAESSSSSSGSGGGVFGGLFGGFGGGQQQKQLVSEAERASAAAAAEAAAAEEREMLAAALRAREKQILANTVAALRTKLAPIRGLPSKQGMDDPNEEIKAMFSMMEAGFSAPTKLFSDLMKRKNSP